MDFADLGDVLFLGDQAGVGIPLALLGAVFLAVGTQLQHRGVAGAAALHGEAPRGLTVGHARALVTRPAWLVGTLMLGLSIVLQLAALWFSPLSVVQPLGAFGLIVTSVLNARLSGTAIGGRMIGAIALCVVGVGAFVTLAAFWAHPRAIEFTQLLTVLVALGVVLAVWAMLYAGQRRRTRPMFYIVAAGMLFGFVATLAKVVIGRIQTLIESQWQFGVEEWLTIGCLVGILLATIAGSWFVQNAHAYGPPDLVVAGLTVVDPIVAVTIGSVVLGEMEGTPSWVTLVMLATAVVAIVGVFLLARQHPQMKDGTYDTGPTASVGP